MHVAPRCTDLDRVGIEGLMAPADADSTDQGRASTGTGFAPATSAGTRVSYRPVVCPDPLVPGAADFRLTGFVCGALTAPLDRFVADGPTIDLMVGIAKATSPDPRPDPIVYLAGGPGSPAMLRGPALVAEGWNADRDVIVLN